MFIPGYGSVLTADFSQPVNPNLLNPTPKAPAPAPVASSWERALATGSGGGTLGQTVQQASTAAAQRITGDPVAASSWERAVTQGGGGSLGEAVRERVPVPAPSPPAAVPAAAVPPAAPARIPSPPPVPLPKAPVVNITTDPGGPASQFDPDPYPTVLPSLSAEQLGQLAERRRLADERLKRAEAESERRRGLLDASALRAREDAERISRRSLQDFMREAGGRGLARSPMVAGRQVRRTGEDLRLAYGEIDTRLSTEISALQDLVARAAEERDMAIAQIEQERVNMQADLDRLFPAAGMFR